MLSFAVHRVHTAYGYSRSTRHQFFNAIWQVTGVTPDRYEFVLCVDADTKVFPDSLTRMAACMSNDQEIMGLCGETKIGNKAESWVTMIQGEGILISVVGRD